MFSSACDIDLLCTRQEEPSVDDWFTAGDASGAVTGGVMVHGSLQWCFADALPNWAAMLPANNDDSHATDACEKMRQRVQKKSWRASMVLGDSTRKQRIGILAFGAWPVERLQSELTHLDGQRNAIFDCNAFEDSLNPFHKARVSLAKILHEGKSGELSPLFDLQHPSAHRPLMQEIREVMVSFNSQIWWRFLEYQTYPVQWARWLHPAVDPATQDECPDHFFNVMKKCCRRREFCQKVWEFYGGDVDRMKADPHFKQALRIWFAIFQFTNMSMERLLALFRQWATGDRLCAEKIVALSALGQLLKIHRDEGYDDPRYQTRAQLLADGVELRCAKGAPVDGKERSSFVNFMMKQESTRTEKLTRADYLQWQRGKTDEFRALGGEALQLEKLEARGQMLHAACYLIFSDQVIISIEYRCLPSGPLALQVRFDEDA